MRRMIHFFQGNTTIEVVCPYPERLMNLCAHHSISFWDLTRIDAVTVGMSMSLSSYRKLLPMLENIGAKAEKKQQKGVPVLFWRVQKRYALLAGLILVLIFTWVLSLFIWEIEIEGNEAVSAFEILQVLEGHGVSIGAFAPNIDPEMLRNRVLLEMEDLSWITVNVHGSRANVIVRERIWAPVMFEESEKTAVYATQSGVIEQMFVWAGTALVEVGDVIEIGQDLITGRMESAIGETWLTRADAEIYARTWYEFSMQMPLAYVYKEYSGETSAKSTIFFGNRRINLFFDSGISYTSYDKIVSRKNFTLPGGIVLPIALERRIYREYIPRQAQKTHYQAAFLLQERLLEVLNEALRPGGQIIRTEFEVEVENGMITVHLSAEAREQVGALRRLTEEERIILPQQQEELAQEGT